MSPSNRSGSIYDTSDLMPLMSPRRKGLVNPHLAAHGAAQTPKSAAGAMPRRGAGAASVQGSEESAVSSLQLTMEEAK